MCICQQVRTEVQSISDFERSLKGLFAEILLYYFKKIREFIRDIKHLFWEPVYIRAFVRYLKNICLFLTFASKFTDGLSILIA